MTFVALHYTFYFLILDNFLDQKTVVCQHFKHGLACFRKQSCNVLNMDCFVSDICMLVWAHFGIFENGVLLMYTLEGVSGVANLITAYEEYQ